jgi:hypothetical protein
MLLAYHEKLSFFSAARRLGAHRQTVQRCVERAMAYGPLAALDDLPRPGKEPTITPEANMDTGLAAVRADGTWQKINDHWINR